jgi:hypothetical protein
VLDIIVDKETFLREKVDMLRKELEAAERELNSVMSSQTTISRVQPMSMPKGRYLDDFYLSIIHYFARQTQSVYHLNVITLDVNKYVRMHGPMGWIAKQLSRWDNLEKLGEDEEQHFYDLHGKYNFNNLRMLHFDEESIRIATERANHLHKEEIDPNIMSLLATDEQSQDARCHIMSQDSRGGGGDDEDDDDDGDGEDDNGEVIANGDDSDGSHLGGEEYEDEEEVWSGPNNEDVCYDMTCHEHVQELQQIVSRWRGHNEDHTAPVHQIAKDMKTVRSATAAFLSIKCIPEVTYGEWEACDQYLEEGSVTKPL